MTYTIHPGKKDAIATANVADIGCVLWGTTYTPKTTFRAVFDEQKGFYFLLTCCEKDPRITYLTPGGEVCEDSCMEVFLNFAPEKTHDYINFEMNAAGAYLFGVGSDRNDRRELHTRHRPTVTPLKESDRWSVLLFIPLETITEIYGPLSFTSGTTFVGNAFKCGDLTPSPHFLSWAPMQEDAVDFHRFDRFGTFVIA